MVDEYADNYSASEPLLISSDSSMVDEYLARVKSLNKVGVGSDSSMVDECYCYFIMSGDRRCNLAKS